MSEFLKKFGKKVRGYRELKQLSQEKLAELANVSTNTISVIELGKTFITYNNLQAICKALEINEVDLFDFKMNNNQQASTVDLIYSAAKLRSPIQQLQILEIIETFKP